MKPFDATGAFRSDVYGMRRLAVRGAGATVLASGLGVAIQIVATMTLARLLTPTDFGVVTMVTTFSLLLVNFGLNGFTEAVLQREEINHALASNLFWINVGGGLLLTVGFATAGSLLARFYGEPRLTAIAVGISSMIFFTSTSVLHLALLKRAMQFGAVSINDIVARLVAVAVSIILAWAGWGYWALVAGTVASPLATAIGAWWMCRWTPGLPHRVPGTTSVVRFAMSVYGRFGISYCARNMDNLLVGWRFGPISLGSYKKAYDLFALSAGQVVAPLSHVAVAALSRLTSNYVQFRRYFLNMLGVTAFVGMGLGAYSTLIGKDLIRLLLGPKWEPAGEIFMFFGPGIGAMFVYYTNGWIHLSIGRADRWFRWGLIEFLFTTFLFLLALPWGAAGIAVAWTASFWILTIPSFWYAGKPINLRVGPVLGAVWKYVVASLVAGCACAAIIRRLPTYVGLAGPAAAFVHIVTISLFFAVLYLVAVILLHRGCEPLYQVARLLREMISLRRPSELSEAVIATGDAYTSRAVMLK